MNSSTNRSVRRRHRRRSHGIVIQWGGVRMRLSLVGLAIIAFVLSAGSVASCRFMVSEHELSGDMVIGLFRTDLGDRNSVCWSLSYKRDILTRLYGKDGNFEMSFTLARIYGVVAPIEGLFAWVFWLLSLGIKNATTRRWTHRFGSILSFGAAAMQALTFLVFNMENCKDTESYLGQCIFSEGAYRASSAAILYVVVGVAMFCIGAPRRELLTFDSQSSTRGDDAENEVPSLRSVETSSTHTDSSPREGKTRTSIRTTRSRNGRRLRQEEGEEGGGDKRFGRERSLSSVLSGLTDDAGGEPSMTLKCTTTSTERTTRTADRRGIMKQNNGTNKLCHDEHGHDERLFFPLSSSDDPRDPFIRQPEQRSNQTSNTSSYKIPEKAFGRHRSYKSDTMVDWNGVRSSSKRRVTIAAVA